MRELQHAIEKAVILADEDELGANDFYLQGRVDKDVMLGNMTIEEMEKVLIEKSLKKNENNISAVANELGVSRPTLYSKIKKYELE